MSLQETIIQQLGVKPVIDAQEEIRRSIDFLKRYLKKHPFLKTFVLGISSMASWAKRPAKVESWPPEIPTQTFLRRDASLISF